MDLYAKLSNYKRDDKVYSGLVLSLQVHVFFFDKCKNDN